jgi:hypothetical protein
VTVRRRFADSRENRFFTENLSICCHLESRSGYYFQGHQTPGLEPGIIRLAAKTGTGPQVAEEDDVMSRTRWVGVGAVLVGLTTALPRPVLADEGKDRAGLAQVPADAPIVVHLKGFERTKDRLVAMIKNALPDLGPMVQAKLEEAMKEGLEGRELKGLVKDGSVFVVFPEMPKPNQDEPAVAIIAAVSDYKAFRDGLLKEEERKNLKAEGGYETTSIMGKDIFFADRKGYALMTAQKELAAKLSKKHAGLETSLNKDIAKKLIDSDVALYVDMAAVNKEFGDQIKAFRPLLEFGLQQASAQLDKNTLEMTKAMFNGVFQFLEDSRVFLVAAEFRGEGLAIHLQTQVGADTKINSYLKNAKSAPLTNLGTLPADQLGYFSMLVHPEMLKAFGPLMQGFVSEGDQAKAFKELFDQMAEAGPQSMMGDFGYPVQGIQVWTYKDPAKATAAQIKLYQTIKEGESFGTMPLKGAPVVKADAETHRGFKFSYVSLKWDFDKFAEKAPQGGKEMADAMKTLMGEGTNVWFGTDGKAYVQVSGKDWTAAKKHLDDFLDSKNTAGNQKAFSEARKHLPAETSMVALMDMPQYIEVMSEFMGPILKGQGLPINIPALKAQKGKSYFGMALTLQPETGSVDLWIPVSAVAEIRKMIEPIIRGGAIQ